MYGLAFQLLFSLLVMSKPRAQKAAQHAQADMAAQAWRTWVTRTKARMTGPGWVSCMKVSRCMRSFSASSSRVWIQPWSRLGTSRGLGYKAC